MGAKEFFQYSMILLATVSVFVVMIEMEATMDRPRLQQTYVGLLIYLLVTIPIFFTELIKLNIIWTVFTLSTCILLIGERIVLVTPKIMYILMSMTMVQCLYIIALSSTSFDNSLANYYQRSIKLSSFTRMIKLIVYERSKNPKALYFSDKPVVLATPTISSAVAKQMPAAKDGQATTLASKQQLNNFIV